MIKSKTGIGEAVGGGSDGGAANTGPHVDPTANVLQLVEAAVERLNDLATAQARRLDEKLDLMTRHMELRAEHAREIRELNDDRLEKIRQVDVAATKTEADRALVAIQALAVKAAADAENIRKALDAAAATIAKSTSDTVGEITTRLAALEKAQYETQGRGAVANPVELMKAIQELKETRSANIATVDQSKNIWGFLIGGLGIMLALLSFLTRGTP